MAADRRIPRAALVGVLGAAVFLSNYKVPLIAVGLVTNAIGIVLMGRIIAHHRRTTAAQVRVPEEIPVLQGSHCHLEEVRS